MKSIKQIRESLEVISEETDNMGVKKLTTLVRAGLFDPNKLMLLRRALNKENVKMTKAERETLLELLDRLLNLITSKRDIFMKVKQNVSEELVTEDYEFSMARSELKTIIKDAQTLIQKLSGEGELEAWMQSKITKAADYIGAVTDNIESGESEIETDIDEEYEDIPLEEAKTKIAIDINQMPPLIVMKRRAIRVFPDGQKVALYWADRINKFISVPFESIGISEAVEYDEDEDEEDKKKRNVYRRKNNSPRFTSSPETFMRAAKQTSIVDDPAQKLGFLAGAGIRYLGRGIGRKISGAIKNARTKAKISNKTEPTIKMNKPSSRRRPGSRLRESNLTIAESFQNNLKLIREARTYGAADAATDAASFIPGPAGSAASLASAGLSLSRGDYVGAGLDVLGAVPVLGYAAKAAKVARAAKASKAYRAYKAKKVLRNAAKGQKNIRQAKRAGRRGKLAAAIGGYALGSQLGGGDGGSGESGGTGYKYDTKGKYRDPFKGRDLSGSAQLDVQRTNAERLWRRQAQQSTQGPGASPYGISENYIKDLFSQHSIQINENVPEKITRVYNSLNKENQLLFEEMINKDKESFQKIISFVLNN